jgi:hypothetical protein
MCAVTSRRQSMQIHRSLRIMGVPYRQIGQSGRSANDTGAQNGWPAGLWASLTVGVDSRPRCMVIS